MCLYLRGQGMEAHLETRLPLRDADRPLDLCAAV